MEQIADGKLLTCLFGPSDFLRALPRDPESIFVCWEITPEKILNLKKQIGREACGASRWLLKVLDVTDIVFNGDNAWQSVDSDIDVNEKRKYVRVPGSGRTYIVQCGIYTPGGLFLPVLVSNVCAVPRSGVSDRLDGEWVRVNSAELLRLSTEALENGGVKGNQLNGAGIAVGGGSGSGGIL